MIAMWLDQSERQRLATDSEKFNSKELKELYNDVSKLYPGQFYIQEYTRTHKRWLKKPVVTYVYSLYSIINPNTPTDIKDAQVINFKGFADLVDEYVICAFFYGLLSPLRKP